MQGNTPLHTAAFWDRPEEVSTILQQHPLGTKEINDMVRSVAAVTHLQRTCWNGPQPDQRFCQRYVSQAAQRWALIQ